VLDLVGDVNYMMMHGLTNFKYNNPFTWYKYFVHGYETQEPAYV